MTRSQSGQSGKLSMGLETHVPALINSTSNRIARGASRVYLKRFGIGINEGRMLTLLHISPGLTANEVCQHADLDKAAASRGVHALERLGLIVTIRENAPKRRRLYLTEKGAVWQKRLAELAKERENRILEGFSAKEREGLLGYLQRLLANASAMNEAIALAEKAEAVAPRKPHEGRKRAS